MAKTWYPVVDYLECIDCGKCVTNCPHNVYDKSKAPSPLVTSPDHCVDHCHFCGNNCPQGAITYVGDNTGWKPPLGKSEAEESSCDCGSSCGCRSDCGCGTGDCSDAKVIPDKKLLVIDFLYLDLKTCERCMGTDGVLMDVINEVSSVLETAGYSVTINKIEITNEELAKQYKFVSSPTIRVNGLDICLEVKENPCGSCSDISEQSVDCRVFIYEGKDYEVPPKAMIINAILKAIYGQTPEIPNEESYVLPENLKMFFHGKANKSSMCCCGGGDCC